MEKKLLVVLTNYTAADINRIYGRQSSEIETILGFAYGDEVIHRSNMVLLSVVSHGISFAVNPQLTYRTSA